MAFLKKREGLPPHTPEGERGAAFPLGPWTSGKIASHPISSRTGNDLLPHRLTIGLADKRH